MKAERLLMQWQREAQLESIPRRTETKCQQCQTKLVRLQAQTAESERELALRRQGEVASQRHLAATMKLRAANRTAAERKAYDAEIRAGQIAFSNVVAEGHPDWRLQEHSNLAFYSQQITPRAKWK
jgi:hypothetical protein